MEAQNSFDFAREYCRRLEKLHENEPVVYRDAHIMGRLEGTISNILWNLEMWDKEMYNRIVERMDKLHPENEVI